MVPDRLCRMVTAYVDGELNPRHEKALLRLLRNSAEARGLLRQLQQDAGQIHNLPAQKLGPDFTQQVLQKLGARPVQPVVRYDHPAVATPLHIGIGLATAAGLLLIVGLGSYYFLKNSPQRGPEIAQSVPRTGPTQPPREEPDPVIVDVEPREVATEPSDVLPFPAPNKPSDAPRPPRTVKREESRSSSTEQLTAPVDRPDPFQKMDLNVTLTFPLREVGKENRRAELLDQLHKANAQRLELECRRTELAMKRIKAALEARQIGVLIDKRANLSLELGLSDYAIYAENVSSDELLAILNQLSSEERRSPVFNGLGVNVLKADDKKQLTRLLGFDPAQPNMPASKKSENGADIHKPISEGTADQILRQLKGQGGARSAGKPITKLPDRLAIVVALTRFAAPLKSEEIQLFRDRRKELQEGRLQVLLFLRGTNRR